MYLNHLIKKQELNLTLLNENGGSNFVRKVTSVTVLENIKNLSWLKGGEFLLTSLDTLPDEEDELEELLQKMQKRISGIAIKYSLEGEEEIGYVETLTTLAESLQIPLLRIPNTITYIELMNYINHELRKGVFDKELKQQFINYLLLNGSKSSISETFIEETIEDIGLNIQMKKDFAQVIRFDGKSMRPNKNHLEYYFEVLKEKNQIKDYFIKLDNNESDIIIYTILQGEDFFEQDDPIFHQDIFSDNKLSIYISSPANLKDLNTLYVQTLLLKRTSKFFQKMVIPYEDIQLLVEMIENKAFVLEYTKPIEEIMKEPIFTETLLCYYKNNENKKKTSEELYIHVNTLNYRLKQISKYTNMDFGHLSDKIRIYLSLFIKILLGEK